MTTQTLTEEIEAKVRSHGFHLTPAALADIALTIGRNLDARMTQLEQRLSPIETVRQPAS